MVYTPEDIDEAEHLRKSFPHYFRQQTSDSLLPYLNKSDSVMVQATVFGMGRELVYESYEARPLEKQANYIYEWLHEMHKEICENDVWDRFMFGSFGQFLKYHLISGGMLLRILVQDGWRPVVLSNSMFHEYEMEPLKDFVNLAGEIHKKRTELDMKYFGLTCETVEHLLSKNSCNCVLK